ncbi:hypothetical protein ACQ1Z3_16060, partial [Enterococcus faecalis]|uniref:hypothetical protein n=1 Tax=Enterococcus faecalis TaxID=1351 RepID=UPI003D6A4772
MISSRFACLAAGFLSVTALSGAASAQSAGSCDLRPVMMEEFNEDTAPNRRIESISAFRIGPARWI